MRKKKTGNLWHETIHKAANAFLIFLSIAVVSVFLFGFASTKQITIIDEGTTLTVSTAKMIVEEALAEQEIVLKNGDKVSVPLDKKLKNHDEIIIYRATKMILTDGGKTDDFYSCQPDLRSALEDAGITLGELDEITPSLDTPVSPDLQIKIVRVNVETVTEEQLMDFNEVKIPRDDMEKGYTKVLQEGDTGWAVATFRVTTRDGEVTEKEMLSQEVLVAPVAKTIEYGTNEGKTVQTSRGNLRYKRVVRCNATAYDPYPAGGSGTGRTATGLMAQYGIIAVDPRVIPLGSKVYIESTDGGKSWVYGFAIAADTGGDIKNNRIDLCYNTKAECFQFGRRSANVYILE